MTNRLVPQSRSDALANVLLGVPLGFAFLGLACLDRVGRGAVIRRGLLLLPACLGFAAVIEFVQLCFPARTCAASDVVCQGLGAAIGMAAWVLFGQRLTEQARAVWSRSGLGGAAGRLLVWYLVLLAFIQLLPMDLSPSPKDLYKKLRDVAVFVPFTEYRGAGHEQAIQQTAKLLLVAGLYLPVGLLAAGLPERFWQYDNSRRVFAAAIGLAVGMEGLQLVVHARVPSATDAGVGAAAALVGWRLRRMRPPAREPLSTPGGDR
jgi:VanZ family protein